MRSAALMLLQCRIGRCSEGFGWWLDWDNQPFDRRRLTISLNVSLFVRCCGGVFRGVSAGFGTEKAAPKVGPRRRLKRRAAGSCWAAWLRGSGRKNGGQCAEQGRAAGGKRGPGRLGAHSAGWRRLWRQERRRWRLDLAHKLGTQV